ncbi:MAG TPA: DUF5919 domain-containing protein [Propionibacteriaceae bacterium]
MPNDRLREAMLKQGMTTEKLAEVLGVDPKTVERWITTGRSPYPRHRYRIGALLCESESYLWPEARTREQAARLSGSEVVHFYPRRAMSPADLWTRLFERAAEQVDVLVYAGLFLPEQYPNLPKTLARKAESGVKIRLLFGDPDCSVVLKRSHEEGIGDAIPVKIRNTLAHYRPCLSAAGVELRLHATTLYNSLYRFDDEVLVNTHIYGLPAAHAPLLHLRELSGGQLFEMYTDSFERIWADSKPASTGTGI